MLIISPHLSRFTLCYTMCIVCLAAFAFFLDDGRQKTLDVGPLGPEVSLRGGFDLPQLVPWYWSRHSAASECDQLEPKQFGHIKQTC